METNPALKNIGFNHNDRILIIHTDDIGMCHASISAYSDLLKFGLISSGATMVPSSWFPKVVSVCKQGPHPDMGIHLTLTSEWDYYRWSPISTVDVDTGLIDEEGYFYRSSEEVQAHGKSSAVFTELKAQVDRAVSAGLEITHLDTHMNTVAHPSFISSYIQLAHEYRLPLLYPRLDEEGFVKLGFDHEISSLAAASVNYLEEAGIPLVDHVTGMNLINPEDRFDQLKLVLEDIQPGITHFIIHPSMDTPELREITPDWKCRVGDYLVFMSEKTREYIHNKGFHIIGYRQLLNLLH